MPRSGIPHPHARGHLHRAGGVVHRGDELPQAFWAPGFRHLPGRGGSYSLHASVLRLLGDHQSGCRDRVRLFPIPGGAGPVSPEAGDALRAPDRSTPARDEGSWYVGLTNTDRFGGGQGQHIRRYGSGQHPGRRFHLRSELRGEAVPIASWAICGGDNGTHIPPPLPARGGGRARAPEGDPGLRPAHDRLHHGPGHCGTHCSPGSVITLLFQHGAFETSDTSRTAWALLFYALGLFSYAGRDTLTRVFYAYQDTRTPVKISVVAVVLNIAVSLVLMRFLGVGGLALGTTIAMTVNMIVLMELLRRRLGPMGFGRLLRSFLRILAAAGIMGLAVWGVDGLLVGWVEVGNLGLGARVAAGMAAGVVVYVGSAALGGIRELDEAKEMLREAFRRSSPEL